MRELQARALPPLRVAIDAQLLPWRNGGVAHALLALIRALDRLEDGGEEYVLVVATPEEEAYWRPLLLRRQTIATRMDFESQQPKPAPPPPPPPPPVGTPLGWPWRPVIDAVRRALTTPVPPPPPPPPIIFPVNNWPELPVSDGFYESLGCHVLHLPWQWFTLSAMPTIFSPHDLQHLHFPQFFTVPELVQRETHYRAGCQLSQAVVVGSEWVKQDVVGQYGIAPEKVQVIREGAPNQVAPEVAEAEVRRVIAHYGLPTEFLLYPAIPWPHKNHLRLLEAIAILRDQRGLTVHLVLTGGTSVAHWTAVEQRIAELVLTGQVHQLGFIPEADLRVIQGVAAGLVQPSLFEASSLPIYDAWKDGVPVACARASALPEQVQAAAELFDPLDVADIARAIARLCTDPDRRDDLRARGRRRLADFDWEQTARAYRALYRQVARRPLFPEDIQALRGTGLASSTAISQSPTQG